MKYRVSFYRKAEVVAGRAPRYMVDFEADTLEQAKTHFERQPDVVVRSVYKAPDKPIRKKPSYVFETAADRNKWYSSHKTAQKERLCHKCKKNEVERYKRLCTKCEALRESAAKNVCGVCGYNPGVFSPSLLRCLCNEAQGVSGEVPPREEGEAAHH